jgi:predicted dehydrogenase
MLGLIGVGRWGQVYLRTIQQLAGRCILKAACCRHPDQAAQLPSSAQIMKEWQAVVRSPCEAVIIATPPDTHAEIVTACLEAGKPCLVEKPFCLDVPTAQHLHQLAVKSGVAVLVDHTQLFHPAYETLRRHLREHSEVPRVVCSEGMAFGPFRRHTSALWDWAPHDVSLCLDLVGRFPTGTVALGGPRDPHGLPEMISLRLEFEHGALAWIHAGRLSPDKRRRLTVVTDRHLYVVDDLAAAPLTVAEIDYARRYDSAPSEPLTHHPLEVGSADPPLTRMLAYFLKGLRGGDRQRFGTALAVDVVRVLAACESAML